MIVVSAEQTSGKAPVSNMAAWRFLIACTTTERTMGL